VLLCTKTIGKSSGLDGICVDKSECNTAPTDASMFFVYFESQHNSVHL
jgi:hypothetical protein